MFRVVTVDCGEKKKFKATSLRHVNVTFCRHTDSTTISHLHLSSFKEKKETKTVCYFYLSISIKMLFPSLPFSLYVPVPFSILTLIHEECQSQHG